MVVMFLSKQQYLVSDPIGDRLIHKLSVFNNHFHRFWRSACKADPHRRGNGTHLGLV